MGQMRWPFWGAYVDDAHNVFGRRAFLYWRRAHIRLLYWEIQLTLHNLRKRYHIFIFLIKRAYGVYYCRRIWDRTVGVVTFVIVTDINIKIRPKRLYNSLIETYDVFWYSNISIYFFPKLHSETLEMISSIIWRSLRTESIRSISERC